ncbi:hypothetical protein HEP84_01220 [Streptomyces sp. RLB1-33]|nr:hypothetical protein [Streptomyces sp. RLB1-33]QIY68121.1 hypothetical protein HEP84_01220 [Streptomyces sp. RLB1-33]
MCQQGLGGPVDKVKALGGSPKMAEPGDGDGLGYGKTIAGEPSTDEIRKAVFWAKVDDWHEGFLIAGETTALDGTTVTTVYERGLACLGRHEIATWKCTSTPTG